MMPFAETFSILAESVIGQDADGNDVHTATETMTRGAFAPEGSSELIQGENVVLTHPVLYLEAGAPVPTPADRVRVRGQLYDVDGEPAVYLNPFTGTKPGPVVKLLKVT